MAYFVRSPHAHAKIIKVDLTAALSLPGVVGALDGRALDGKVANMPTLGTLGVGGESGGAGVEGGGSVKRATLRKALPIDEVQYQGEAVAVVFAKDIYTAEDAAESSRGGVRTAR